MNILRNAFRAAMTPAVAVFLATGALAAAPDLLDPDPPAAPIADYSLDTVLVVHNWILCVTETSAESLVRAREAGPEAAAQAYAELAAAKSCGRFAKLGVMLKQPLYRTGPGKDYEARAFGALVNVGAGWQSGFVVVGLPE
jgi:hypothetical protein